MLILRENELIAEGFTLLTQSATLSLQLKHNTPTNCSNLKIIYNKYKILKIQKKKKKEKTGPELKLTAKALLLCAVLISESLTEPLQCYSFDEEGKNSHLLHFYQATSRHKFFLHIYINVSS